MPVAAPSGRAAPSNAPRGQGQGSTSQQAQTAMRNSFLRSTRIHWERGQTKTATPGTATQPLNFEIPIYGYLKCIYLNVSLVTAGNSANVTMAADAPFNVFTQILLRDSGGVPIWNLSGYRSFLAAQYGNFFGGRDITADTNTYNGGTTGTGATGGSFSFMLPIPQQFGQNGLGVLPNWDTSTKYFLDLTVNTNAALYGTAPTAAGTLTVTPFIEAYMVPPSADALNNPNTIQPPGAGIFQAHSSQQFVAAGSGDFTFLSSRTGNLIRNLILECRNSSDVRTAVTTQITSNLTWEFDNGIERVQAVQEHWFQQWLDVPIVAPTGVLVFPYWRGPLSTATLETGEFYIDSFASTKLLLRATAGAAGNFYLITNDIIVPTNAGAAIGQNG